MATLLLTAAIAAGPSLADAAVVESRCDVLEWQAKYDEHGCYEWAQYIGWVWKDGRFEVVWWCFDEPERGALSDGGITPSLNGDTMFLHHSDGRLYQIRFKELRRRWSTRDFELEARNKLPPASRRGP